MSKRASDLISISRVGEEAWLEYNVEGLRLRVEMTLEELQSLVEVSTSVIYMLKEHLKPDKNIRKWIPEVFNKPGYYANYSDTSVQIDKGSHIQLWCNTVNPLYARQFDTEKECQEWCEDTTYKPLGYDFGE